MPRNRKRDLDGLRAQIAGNPGAIRAQLIANDGEVGEEMRLKHAGGGLFGVHVPVDRDVTLKALRLRHTRHVPAEDPKAEPVEETYEATVPVRVRDIPAGGIAYAFVGADLTAPDEGEAEHGEAA